jgi:hypothetical protein
MVVRLLCLIIERRRERAVRALVDLDDALRRLLLLRRELAAIGHEAVLVDGDVRCARDGKLWPCGAQS